VDFNRIEKKSYKTLSSFEKEIIDQMINISLAETQNEDGIRKELIEVLMGGVEGLPEQQRKVLTWMYGLDGKALVKESEIAKRLDITQQAVSRLKKRAEAQLKKKLDEFMENNF
jgi:RNA polymerase sigma factor (sigma-70 family)